MRRGDDIAFIESAYDLEADWSDWMQNLATLTLDRFAPDRGIVAVRWRQRPDDVVEGHPLYLDVPNGYERLFEENRRIFEENGILALAPEFPVATLREVFPPEHPYLEHTLALARPCGISDVLKVSAHDTPVHMLSLSPLYADPYTVDAGLRARFTRMSGHLTAGLRLRSAMGSSRVLPKEAVFDPSGKDQHAEGAARRGLDALRRAVVEREKARSSLRRTDPDEAIGLWRGLVEGRWSLVDRFESDGEGRRFVVAIPNDNETPDPRALTAKEELVSQLVGAGRSNKEIAYQLGISEHTVATHVSSSLGKLGCEGRGDLIRWMHAENVEFTTNIHGVHVGVLAEPESDWTENTPALTAAESDVLDHVRRGLSNKAIAAARGSSPRTVANQVASILRKTGAYSRYELMSASAPE